MKKILCIIMSLVLLMGCLPVTAFAATEDNPYICYNYTDCTENGEIYEVIDDGCPVRAKSKSSAKILTRLDAGMFVSVKEIKVTARLTRWARIEYPDGEKIKSAWIFIGNLEKHKHDFTTVMKDGRDNLRLCYRCGHAICETDGQVIIGNITSIVAQTVLGDFSEEKTTILGFIGRCIASELWVADVRDIISDLWYGAPWQVIGMDLAGIIPLVSVAKLYAKNSDMLPDLVKHGGKLLKNTPEIVNGVYDLGKYKIPETVMNTFLYGNRGLNKAQNGIQGAHNLTAFKHSLGNVNGQIVQKTAHSTIDGVYNILYTFEKSDGTTATARIAKTVYDTEKITDMEMLQYMMEAFSNPRKIPGTDNRYVGKALNGLWFEGSIDEATGEIVHIFISLDDLGAKYGL